MPREFLQAVQTMIVPGTTILVTQAPVLPHKTGKGLTLLANAAP